MLCVLAAAPSIAQQRREPTVAIYPPPPRQTDQRASPAVLRVLTGDEGLAVLGAALESRAHPDFKSDCSHLVHAIYERAGFAYAYASSAELYTGTSEFRRVTRPQPGDLVVWPGHVGIAVNPAQHSFFSALSSGLGVDSYDSAYWRERGRPRFLRYVTNVPAGMQVPPSGRESGLRTTASPESPRATTRNVRLAANEDTETAGSPANRDSEDSASTLPRFQFVNSESPRAEQVSDALEGTYSETEEALRGKDVLRLPRPLIIFDRFSVERIRLQRDRGWAEVRIAGAVSVLRGKPDSKKHAERQRWQLVRRDRDTWEITLPPRAIYLPSDMAVRMVVHQLAVLTEETGEHPDRTAEKVELSRLLGVLLQK
ncbi:MAG: C40 family peptidase [Acidobacteriia bacterium]|nr:C40 family peptidase [Terriglobia bacterium]